ncbi:MAG: alpha/beta hydrolase [Pseudomonadota bacterium]
MKDWDDAFANLAYIAGGDALLDDIAREAAAFRTGVKAEFEVPYGDRERTRFDLFFPEATPPKGLMIFIHGGYWMHTSKSDWSYLAAAALARGYVACFPGYTLAPQALIAEITQEVGLAIAAASTRVQGPIFLAGHSAGGHLVARMVCEDSPLSPTVLSRIKRVMPISGVFDLRPLMKTQMNQTLGLTDASAIQESPVLKRPLPSIPVDLWVGSAERPEFLRQSRLLNLAWQGFDAEISLIEDPDAHHFSVLDGLRDGASPLAERLFAN